MAQAQEQHQHERESVEHIYAPQGAIHEVALARFLAGGKWRLAARWLGLGIFIFGSLLLAWLFWQVFQGFQNFARPDYLSDKLNRVQGDSVPAAIIASVSVIGTEFLKWMYLLLLGILACLMAGLGIRFFAASEAVIDEAVLGHIDH